MRYHLRLLCFMLCLSQTVSAQVMTLKGDVTDSKTGQPVPGVTVRSGSYGTATDKEGAFVLLADQALLQQQGMTLTSIGYEKLQVAYRGTTYHIQLKTSAAQLNMVVISGAGET